MPTLNFQMDEIYPLFLTLHLKVRLFFLLLSINHKWVNRHAEMGHIQF